MKQSPDRPQTESEIAMTPHERIQAMLLCFVGTGVIAITACVYAIVLLVRIKHLTQALDERPRYPKLGIRG